MLIISIIALIITASSLLISFLNYKDNKSNIIIKIQRICPTALTTVYPSMENDNSEYKFDILISNSGNKDETICDFIYFYKNKIRKDIPITLGSLYSKVKAKEQILFELEIKRIDLENLLDFGIRTINNKVKRASKAQIKNYKKVLQEHKRQLSDEWENGVRKIKFNG
jgi:hypothetical protein